MQIFSIPDDVINGVAAEIHAKTNKDYKIPIVGVPENLETPQIFEIMPFDQIDAPTAGFFAIDGSRNSHTFYNGVSLCFYQAGYVCFRSGQQVRLNTSADPVVLGKVLHGTKMLVLNDEHLGSIYDEFLSLPAVASLIAFFGDKAEDVFPYKKDLIINSISTLLGFCQEVLEWALLYDIATNGSLAVGDFILRDGALRSLNIKQRYLVNLGHLLHAKGVRVVGVTKQNPVKTELTYTYSKIDSYLQSNWHR